MYKYSIRGLALALGMTAAVGSAHAFPSGVVYWTSALLPAAPGAPHTQNQGGLCNPTSASPTGCQIVPVGNQGPIPSGGVITFNTVALPSGDSNYELDFTIQDLSSTIASYYEVTLNNIFIGSTPIPTTTHSAGTIRVTLTNGMTPHTDTLGITNGYFANTASPSFPGGDFSLTVSEIDVPEPGSMALLGAGLGVLGLVRRYRAGAWRTGA